MARPSYPVIGAFNGPMHPFASSFLTQGRSLHPMQRIGDVAHTGWPSEGAGATPGLGNAPPAGGPDLKLPLQLSFSLTTATNPAARV